MTNEMNTVPELRFPNFCDEWVNYKLGEIVDIRGRIGFRGYTKSDIIDKEDGGILTFSPTNIISNKLKNTVHDTYITKEKYEESPEIMVKNGDILFVKTGSTLGKSTLVTNLNEEATVNPQIVVMRVKEFFHQKFTSTYLTLNKILRQVAQIRIGGAIPTLTESEIKKFQVSFPAYEEQKKIGYFFSKLDRQIELEEKKLELLEQQKKGYMQRLFSQKLRFKGENGKVYPNWDLKKLGDILERGNKEKVNNIDKYRRVTVSLHGKGLHEVIQERKTKDTRPFYQRFEGELIIGKQNFFNGSIAIVPSELNGFICSNAIMSYKINNYIDKKYLLEYLLQNDFLRKNEYLADGTGQKELSEKKFEELEIKIPNSIEEQEKIGSFFNKIDNLIELQTNKIESLKQRKKGLLQKMFV